MNNKLSQLFQRYEQRVSNPSVVKRLRENVKKIYSRLYFWQQKDLEKQVKEIVEQKKEVEK